MGQDKTEITEDDLNRSYKVGVSEGWTQAANWLMNEALGCFERGSDDWANRLRLMSRNAKATAEKEHPGKQGA